MPQGQISELRLRNYKTYSNQCTLVIKPLTLLYGYNSAGKSTVLRFLKVLADSSTGNEKEPIKLSSPALRGAPFDQLISKYTDKSDVIIGASFGDLSFDYTIRNFPDERRQVVTQIQVSSPLNKKPINYLWQNWGRASQLSSVYLSTKPSETFGREDDSILIRFNGLSPHTEDVGENDLFDGISNHLTDFASNFFWLSSHREKLDRFELDAGTPNKVTETGRGISRMLHDASKETISKISAWFERSTGYGFQRIPILIGDAQGFRFTLHPNNNPKLDIDVADTGEGMGQVLPVIALLALASENQLGSQPTLAFEHPELHIHPDAHVHLAFEFCDAVQSLAKPTIIIESHSENILLGIQLAITEGRISPRDVSLNWVSETNDGTILENIPLDDQARPVNGAWPSKVFQENIELAKTLMKKRRDH